MAISPHTKVGIIAGGGSLPEEIVQFCEEVGKPYHILPITGQADESWLENLSHTWVTMAGVGRILKTLKTQDISEVVFAGNVKRPSLSSIKPDLRGIQFLAKLSRTSIQGDDALLREVIHFFENEGYHVLSSQDFSRRILAAKGVLGSCAPNDQDLEDIKRGITVAHQIGMLDIGQAVIVENGLILGVEGVEGTKGLIQRCGKLKKEKDPIGVLIKGKKPQQEERIDLPSIGPDTIKDLKAAGFRGVAVEEEGGLLINREELLKLANELDIFVYGFSCDDT